MVEVEFDHRVRLLIGILHFAMQVQVEGVDLLTVSKLGRVEPSRHSEDVNRCSLEAPATLCTTVRRGTIRSIQEVRSCPIDVRTQHCIPY